MGNHPTKWGMFQQAMSAGGYIPTHTGLQPYNMVAKPTSSDAGPSSRYTNVTNGSTDKVVTIANRCKEWPVLCIYEVSIDSSEKTTDPKQKISIG